MKPQLPNQFKLIDTRLKNGNLKTIKYNDRYLHSLYDPIKEAESELNKYPNFDQYETIIIMGLGMGYILDIIHKKNKNSSATIIGIEHEKSFKMFTIEKKYPETFTLYYGLEKNRLFDQIIKIIITTPLKKILFIELISIIDIEPDYYLYIKKRIITQFQQKIADITTTAYFNKQWLMNSFINIKNIKNFTYINDFKDSFSNRTALLVSSGPSVENNLEKIKEFPGYVFCLAPSINYLLKKGVIPDFIILGDSSFQNIHHLKNALKLKINLITDLSIHYTILKKWAGTTILFNYNIPGFGFFHNHNHIDYIPQGGTIASSALMIIQYMGFSNLILLGQDFAYQDFKHHVSGSGYESFFINRNNKFNSYINLNFELIKDNKCEYIDGKLIDHKLKLYKDWFFKLLKTVRVKIITYTKNVKIKSDNLDINLIKSFSIEKEIKYLLNKLLEVKSKLQSMEDINSFLKEIKNDANLYDLLKGFNYQTFLKHEQTNRIEKTEFQECISNSLDEIKTLIQSR